MSIFKWGHTKIEINMRGFMKDRVLKDRIIQEIILNFALIDNFGLVNTLYKK